MNRVTSAKDGKHGLVYVFWLSRIVSYFDVDYAPVKEGFVKKMFNVTTFEDNKCIPKRSGTKSKSIVADLIDTQTKLRKELKEMAIVMQREDDKIVALKAANGKVVMRDLVRVKVFELTK